MYDCLQDSYTDFSFATYDAVGRTRPLSGSLSATLLHTANSPALEALAAYAREKGFETEHQADLLTIQDIGLIDALTINTRFGDQLIISCDLRRDPPVSF